MHKITNFERLSIEEAKEALTFAMSVLEKQTVHIFTPIIVHVQSSNTHGAKDLFSIFVYYDKKRRKGKEIVLKVTLFSEHLAYKEGGGSPKERLATIGEYGQWVLTETK